MARNVFRQGKKVFSISANGSYNIKLGSVRISGARLEVRLESSKGIFPLRGAQLSLPSFNDLLPGGGSRVCASNESAGLIFSLNVILPEEGPFLGLSLGIRNLQRAVIPLQQVTLLSVPLRKISPIGSAPRPYMVVDSGEGSGSSGLHALSGGKTQDELELDFGKYFVGLLVQGGSSLFIGSLLRGKTETRYFVDRDRLEVVAEINGEISPYGAFATEPLLLGAGENMGQLLRSYSAFYEGRRFAFEASQFHAWYSGDWYEEGLAESDIMDNLEFLKETPWLRDNIKYVIVGRGWEKCPGDWSSNERFPSLMDTVAARISDAGFSPGIWISPLKVLRESSLAEKNPDWLLRPAGKVKQEEPVAQLDYTLREVRQFVYETLDRLLRWGYRFIWTDFSGVSLDPKAYKYRGKEGSLLQALRALMTTTRAALGERVFWLAEGAPFPSVAGLCDALCVAPRARPYFSTLLASARTGMHRFYLHGGPWLNSPGLLVVRGPETGLPEALKPGDNAGGPYERYRWQSGPMLSLQEARLWATWLIMSGGVLTLGDRLASLKAEGLEIVRKVLVRAGNGSAVPLDFGVVPLPRIWQKVEEGTVSLALFNWGESEQEIVATRRHGVLFPDSGELYEVWKDETVLIEGDSLRRRLAPRSCELFEWEISSA